MEALLCYLVMYYCFFLPALLFVFYAYLVLVLSYGVLVFVAVLALGVLTLVQGAVTGPDLRLTLAYSTAVNLSVLLLSIGLR